MSTQQILGVVGGVVGAFFGYPQLGFVVGSLVGGLLTPGERTEGPRVDDLEVQVSTYGAGIPILYGTERVGGNVVWSTNKIEIEQTTGGKGGEPENTTYRYYVHMGIVLCETPRDGSTVGIVQIFQDGKLIYDARTGIPVSAALASEENPHAYFVLYQGHVDQLPDPGEEAWMGGPGSVPAYRGVVRVRMNAIECPGGRVPQFSFVISTTAEQITTATPMGSAPRGVHAVIQNSSVWHFNYVDPHSDGTDLSLEVFYGDATSMTLSSNIPLDYGKPGFIDNHTPIPCQGMPSPTAIRSRSSPSGLEATIDLIDLQSGVVTPILDYSKGVTEYAFLSQDYASSAYDPVGNKWVMRGGGESWQETEPVVISNREYLRCDPLVWTPGPVAIYDNIVYALTLDTQQFYIELRDAVTGTIIGTPQPAPAIAGVSIASIRTAAIQVDGNGLYVSIHTAPVVLLTKANIFKITGAELGAAQWSLIATTTAPVPYEFAGHSFFASDRMQIIGPSSADLEYTFIRQSVGISDVLVADVIADLCDRSVEDRYDVSGIPVTDMVHGYKLQNPASARTNIDPLLTAFVIYIVDEDGVIKFKKYEDIVPEAIIAYDELGQAEDGTDPADAMPLNRAQEIDMPRSVSVSYIEPAFDYQTASEKEVRQITEATEDLVIELPIATSSDHSKQVASMILYAKWRAQNTRSFKTSRKFAFLSPGDGVTVEYPRGASRLWRITSMTDTGVLCEFNVEPGDAELYMQTAIGATGYQGQEVSALAPPTLMVIGDWAMLRDEDNSAGPYVAMEGYTSGWSGAELFIGDDDTNLQSRGTVSGPALIGFAETTLGDWQLEVVDETNLLTVNIGEGELSSITRDAMLAGTSNVFALGAPGRWEIAQFQRADDLGSGRYILSGLRRGLRGTQYAASTHTGTDRFVLLAVSGMLKPSMEVGAIGQTKSYRPVSKGRSINSAPSTPYAGTGEPLKPFSPVDLRKALSGNDIVFTWHRRTRMSENVLAGIFPLGEASERYVLELCTNSTFESVFRTFEVTSETATYTEAMQDFDGYVSGPLYARVVQISDAVGRGHELEAIL